jgi:hypothetical protein
MKLKLVRIGIPLFENSCHYAIDGNLLLCRAVRYYGKLTAKDGIFMALT